MDKGFAAELFDLSGLRASVVGGTGVLGGSFARCLAAAGAEVFILGRSMEKGEGVQRSIVEQGGKATFVLMDATNRSSVERAATLIAPGGLDILVNAAGANDTTPFAALSDEGWNHLLEVNLSSVFKICQVFAPLMTERGGNASIINISSTSSGPPLSRVFGYGVAKAGVNNLTQYLARELAPLGIRVNALVPGFFPAEQNRAILTPERVAQITGHTPLARLGEAKELDGALLWLASAKASNFVTGSLVRVDGGFSSMSI